ncbi:MAG: hypothetical protein V1740_05310 [Candidatus Woesearchaeota archaeon]
MKPLKHFEDYMKDRIVKRVNVNKERAKSLVIESERKINSLKEKLKKIGIKEENANDYVEYCYDIMMHLIRAKLFLEGYTTGGQGAHEAEVSYLRILKFTEKDVQFANGMRYFRNRILYYGKALDKEYADMVVDFTKTIYPKLRKLVD